MNKKSSFKGFRVTEASIKLNPMAENEGSFKLSPHFQCKMMSNETNFSLSLSVDIDNSILGEKTPFDLKVECFGNFELGLDLCDNKPEQLRFALNSLFPYLRSFVTSLTTSCGVPPFYLPYIDVDAMIANMTAEKVQLN